MPYTRPSIMDQDDDEVIATEQEADLTVPDNAPPEEKTFAKRYGDLRRHAQQTEANLRAELATAKEQLKSASANTLELPTKEEDIDEWVKNFPDVANIVIGLANRQAKKLTADLSERVSAIDERETKLNKAEAQRKLAEKHPDFFDVIRKDEAFHDWMAEQSQEDQDALYNNETDWKRAVTVINAYKYEKGVAEATKVKVPGKRDAAKEVKTGSHTQPGNGTGHTFSESQIRAMSGAEYDVNEEAITKAMAEGKVLLDLTGGAR